MKIIMPATVLW